ncbi:C-type lectin domain family 2 member B-like isoform X2 [Pleurodeles waltl]|uniref:C-type lectin domain family 2 member B-like isoform X2 n=1 Tax=Pleurodeles waltl TaxID=8319 RepID=UPI003709C269
MESGPLQRPGPGVGGKYTGIPQSPETLPASEDRGGIGNSPRLQTRVARPSHLFPIIGILCAAVVALVVYCGVLKRRKCPDHRDLTPLNYFDPPCAEHWLWYLGTCYFFSEDEGSWTFANKSCWEMNSSLALIDLARPALELTFLLRYKGSSDHWIGLRRTHKKLWQWPDGSNFTNQFVVEGDSDCAYLNEVAVGSGRCYNKRNWVCTKKQWKN